MALTALQAKRLRNGARGMELPLTDSIQRKCCDTVYTVYCGDCGRKSVSVTPTILKLLIDRIDELEAKLQNEPAGVTSGNAERKREALSE